MVWRLYRTPAPETSLQETQSNRRIDLSKLGILQGAPEVNTIAGRPGEAQLNATYRGKYASRLGLELQELSESETLQPIPLSNSEGSTEFDGYFTFETSDYGRLEPQRESLVRYETGLVRKGTRASHRKAIHTHITQPSAGNQFGNSTRALIGIPSAATRLKWIDDIPASDSETPTIVETRSARFGNVDVIDARAPSFSDPILVYDLSYSDQGDTDPGVWDSYGNSSPTDADGIVQWGRVFDTQHDSRENDEFILENGLIRLFFDDSTNSLSAETWDATSITKADSTDDWIGGNNTSLSVSTEISNDGKAVRGDTDDASDATSRNMSYEPGGTFDLSNADTVEFWYYTDNAGGGHVLNLRDSSNTTESVAFESDVEADTGSLIKVSLSDYSTVDLSSINRFRWTFDSPADEDKFIIVDSVRYGDFAWQAKSLGSSDWELVETNLREINGMRIDAMVTFRDSTNIETEFDLLCRLPRGFDFPLWLLPEDSDSSVPSGLSDLLDPIANDQAYTASPEFGLVKREDI